MGKIEQKKMTITWGSSVGSSSYIAEMECQWETMRNQRCDTHNSIKNVQF